MILTLQVWKISLEEFKLMPDGEWTQVLGMQQQRFAGYSEAKSCCLNLVKNHSRWFLKIHTPCLPPLEIIMELGLWRDSRFCKFPASPLMAVVERK